MKFRVWDADAGDRVDDAVIIDEDDMRDAARVFAEKSFHKGDYFESTEVHVQAFDNEDIYEVHVDVESVPSFYADRPRLLKPASGHAGGGEE